jgi:hypothetical protein
MIKLFSVAWLCAGLAMAQGEPEKVTVPLHDPARPARIRAQLMMGGITVRGADIRNVVVEANGRGAEHPRRHESRPSAADGMKRLELPGSAGLEITEDDNVVNIKTASWNRAADLTITVPRHSSLQLKCMNDGDIYVEQVDGEIDTNNLNGKITLRNVSGSVVAHSLNGAVLATMDRADPGKPMSFSTLNGDIDVTLPPTIKANVRMKTDNGEIYSDFDVKLEPGSQMTQNEPDRDRDRDTDRERNRERARYHVRFDRGLRGTINGGGPEFQFTSFNGQIYIRKKK